LQTYDAHKVSQTSIWGIRDALNKANTLIVWNQQ